MLISQAHTLDAIFGNLARRAELNAGEYLGACETYLKVGTQGTKPMPSNIGDIGDSQESARGLCKAGERDNRSTASEQRSALACAGN